MKSNEQITALLQQRKFDGVRYACIDRLALNRIDAQAWLFLGQAMIGLKRGSMAKLCFERSALLDPFATWVQQAWNEAESVGIGRDDKQVLKLLETPAVTVSACILTRDSSRTIRQCIEALQDAVDEIIVVDTGSQDDTVQIVESLGVPVHHFEWIDDFAAARNYAQSLATSAWVIAVDSDEILVQEDVKNIRTCVSLFTGKKMALMVQHLNRVESDIQVSTTARMIEIKSGMRWLYPIHEILESAAGHQNERLTTHPVNIRFFHDGYDPAVVNVQQKIQRNIDILEHFIRNNPDSVLHLFYLGREWYRLGDWDKAYVYMQKASELAHSVPDLEIVPEIPGYLERIKENSRKGVNSASR